jgi:hypothetical protein
MKTVTAGRAEPARALFTRLQPLAVATLAR